MDTFQVLAALVPASQTSNVILFVTDQSQKVLALEVAGDTAISIESVPTSPSISTRNAAIVDYISRLELKYAKAHMKGGLAKSIDFYTRT